MGLEDTRSKLEAWRRDYNEVKWHSAIGYNVPKMLMNRAMTNQPFMHLKLGKSSNRVT